jgi:DNA-binding transcriptional MerR regulator
MFSIGEFARLGGVSIRTLRHYDEIGLLRPATVDQDTGYRGYAAAQLGRLNRIMALKDLGLSLTQVRRLLDGVTLGELHGMLVLRRAQLEHEIEQHTNQLLGVEARLRSIAREDDMPADDIVAKTIPAMGVVAIAGRAPGFGPANIVPVVNQPAPAQYRVLPEIEAAVTVRSGPATTIYPMVYHDLARWIEERGYRPVPGPTRDVWVHEIDDIAAAAQQVIETQLPFTRPADAGEA